MSTLYIIGNGFDIHHGLSTKYSHYKKYLQNNNIYLYKNIILFDYFANGNIEDSWNSLDDALDLSADGFMDTIIENSERVLKSGEIDYDSIKIDIENIAKDFKNFTNDYFFKWISSADDYIGNQLIIYDTNPIFITFNYTNILENI